MVRWVLAFLVVALVAALLGFTGIAADIMWVARILCFLFVVILVICFMAEGRKRRLPPRPPI